jgi:hypothetical protein
MRVLDPLLRFEPPKALEDEDRELDRSEEPPRSRLPPRSRVEAPPMSRVLASRPPPRSRVDAPPTSRWPARSLVPMLLPLRSRWLPTPSRDICWRPCSA